MEETVKWILHRAKEDLIQDLQPKYILPELLDLGVVTKKQEKEIMKHEEEEMQAMYLLNIIEQGGQEAYVGFKKCLKSRQIYSWLAEVIEKHDNEIKSINLCNLSNVLTRGGVPRLVPNAIQRKTLLRKVKQKLMGLSDCESGWVTIHGMGGLGKTFLAAAAVRDVLLLHHMYPRGVFWIKIGSNITEDNLMNKMHALCEKFDSNFCGKLPSNVEMAAERLRTLFGSEEHNKCLIVLDDVWSDLAIRIFDLGCRVLVTTRDRSIMEVATSEVDYLELTDGFSLEETKQFFADSHKLKVEQLPSCVSDIWNTAKGYPLVMAIINSKVGEHSKSMDEAFKMCLGKLHNRSLINLKNRLPYEYKCVTQALEMSIETLNENKDYYFDLALFPDDCYISREVLMNLWRLDKLSVEEIMNSFTDKALAMEVPNGHHTTYYTIHDMYLQYLYENIGDKLHERHKDLIKCYLEKSEERYDKIVHDGYILLYLGYHLYKGEMFDVFSEVFLDLKFILTKLSAAGPADLLGDFQRYKLHINKDGLYSKQLNDFEKFVRSCTHLLTNPSYDMLQIALSQAPDSEVYKQATQICKERPNIPYYIWCNRHKLNSPCKLSTRLHNYGVVCISILVDNQHIASGGCDGVIKIWDFLSGQISLILKGHSQQITCLANYKRDNSDLIIISSSEDHLVKVWRITPKDFQRKRKHRANTINSCLVTFMEHKASVLSCAVHQEDKKVASFDNKGIIQIWKVESGESISSCEVSDSDTNMFAGCEFSRDGSAVIVAKNSSLILWDIAKQIPIWEVKMGSGSFTSCHVSAKGDQVLATHESNLAVYDMESGKKLMTLCEPRGKFLRSCAFSSDGEFIAAGNMESAVIVWDKKQHKAIDYLYGHKETVTDVAFLPLSPNINEDGIQLASAAADGTVMIWKTTLPTKKFDTILKEIYSVQYDENSEPTIAIADMNNQIQVTDFYQDTIAGQISSSKPNFSISCCALSHNRQLVLFGSTTGDIQIFYIESGTTTKVGKLQKEITCVAFTKDDVHMSAGTKDGIILIFTFTEARWTYGHCDVVTNLTFLNDDLRLISCSFDGNLIVWGTNEAKEILKCSGHKDSVVDCDVHDKIIVSASTDKTFRLWNGDNGKCFYISPAHSNCVRCVTFNRDGSMLLSGDDFGDVRLWEVSKDVSSMIEDEDFLSADCINLTHLIHQCASESWINDMRFSGDGSRFVVCSDAITWWSTEDVEMRNENVRPLQTFPIRGRKVGKIFCSDNFESFVALDDTGVLYCLQLLHNF